MVLQGDYQPQGYAHDSYSNHAFGHKEDYYHEDSYNEHGSSMQMHMRPNIITPQPAKHYMGGHGQSYGYQGSGYGKQQNFHGHGFPGGKHQSDGMFGRTHQGFLGHQSHGYPKPSYGMHQGATNIHEYESHQGYNMHKAPGGFQESMSSYDYNYAEERDRCPPYYEQQRMHSKNWTAAKGDDQWVSKGL